MTTISNVQQQPSANYCPAFCHMPLQANQRIKNIQYHFNWSKGNCLIKHDPTLPSSPVHFQPLVLLELTMSIWWLDVTIMSMYMETEKDTIKDTYIEDKNNYIYVQPQRDRQTKKREIQLPWLPFCSCHWLPRYLLAPLALSSVVFSFVSPSISHTMHRLSGCQNCKGAQYPRHAQNIFFLYQSIVIFVPFYPEPHSLSCYLVVLIYSYLLFYTAFTICFVFQLLICKGICNSKLVCIFFFCGTQNKIFW